MLTLALIFQLFLFLTLYIRLPAVFQLLMTPNEKVHSRLALLSYYYFESHKNFPTELNGLRAHLKTVRHLK
jgi:hypothetical protein